MLPAAKSPLFLCSTHVRQDDAGRYRINDLHAAAVASGVTKDIRPNEFFSSRSTLELISELTATEISVTEKINDLAPINVVKGFDIDQGTYVCKEMVYAYAMWISPAFMLQVIRTFDAVVTGKLAETTKALSSSDSFAYDLEKEVRYLHDVLAVEGYQMTTLLPEKRLKELRITAYDQPWLKAKKQAAPVGLPIFDGNPEENVVTLPVPVVEEPQNTACMGTRWSDILHTTFAELPFLTLQEGQFLSVDGIACAFLGGEVWCSLVGLCCKLGIVHEAQYKRKFCKEHSRLQLVPTEVGRRTTRLVPLYTYLRKLSGSGWQTVRKGIVAAGFQLQQVH